MLRRRMLGSLIVAGVSLLTLASKPFPTRAFGPAWVSIEYPPSPYDETTRGAYLLVHAYHHGTPADFPVAGTAEGLVSGQRRSVRLEFTRTSRLGTYALRRQWPSEGVWTLVINVSQGSNDLATALVDIASSGDVSAVRVPTERQGEWTIPKRVSISEVESALRARASGSASGR
jgi:hypothetical protein